MYNKEKLITDKLPPLSDAYTQNLKRTSIENINLDIEYNDFVQSASTWLLNSNHRTITGQQAFPVQDIVLGCNHYIDNLLIMHEQTKVQIFEHDYGYYKKINPNIEYVTLDTLDAYKPLLMSMPFSGALGIHREMDAILQRCNELGIDVHLDGAWLPTAFDLVFNFDQPCIKSFAVSMSKAIDLPWNRIGIRWRREHSVDNISLFNQHHMLHASAIGIAQYFIDNTDVDYFIDTYKERYFDICKSLRLRPSNVIHCAMSIDRHHLYGLRDLLVS